MARVFKPEPIVLFGDPVLRQKAQPVTVFHKNLQNKVDIMETTLRLHGGGAAIAAPQIALPKRIVVIRYMGEYLEMINPVMLESSGALDDLEGCLSLPGYIGKVTRAASVTVEFADRFGKLQTVTRENEMARCIQHEMDHLDGILYIDRMTEDFLIDTADDSKFPLEEARKIAGKTNV